jgi:hypothetical protein
MLIDLSLIWSALGLMSRQGLFPIPIEDISARRISEKFQFKINGHENEGNKCYNFSVKPGCVSKPLLMN